MTSLIKDKIQTSTLEDALRLHLLIKSYQKGFNLSMADINTLIELKKSGYTKEFFNNCLTKGYYKSEQTIRNAVAKMTTLGILSYEKRGNRIVNSEYIPELTDRVIFQYVIGNL